MKSTYLWFPDLRRSLALRHSRSCTYSLTSISVTPGIFSQTHLENGAAQKRGRKLTSCVTMNLYGLNLWQIVLYSELIWGILVYLDNEELERGVSLSHKYLQNSFTRLCVKDGFLNYHTTTTYMVYIIKSIIFHFILPYHYMTPEIFKRVGTSVPTCLCSSSMLYGGNSIDSGLLPGNCLWKTE